MGSHPIVHVEIPAMDQESTGAFYSELFGWEYQSMPEMNYAGFQTGSGPSGGFPKVDGEVTKPGEVLVHVGTDDVTASLAKAESLGATTIVPKTEIPGYGWFGVFTDPTGNRIGLYQAPGD